MVATSGASEWALCIVACCLAERYLSRKRKARVKCGVRVVASLRAVAAEGEWIVRGNPRILSRCSIGGDEWRACKWRKTHAAVLRHLKEGAIEGRDS